MIRIFDKPRSRKNLAADPIIALIHRQTQPLIRLHRIQPLFLQRIRMQLIRQPNPAALLPQIDQHAFPFLLDHLHRRRKLRPAVAPRRPKTSPVKHSLCTRTSTGSSCTITFPSVSRSPTPPLHRARCGCGSIDALIRMQLKRPPSRRQRHAFNPPDKLLALQPIADQIRDRAHLQTMLLRRRLPAPAGAPSRRLHASLRRSPPPASSPPGVHRSTDRLRLPRPHQHPPASRPQRIDMPRPQQILRLAHPPQSPPESSPPGPSPKRPSSPQTADAHPPSP